MPKIDIPSGEWLERVEHLAGGLDAEQASDFKHVAYIAGARAVMDCVGFPGGEPDPVQAIRARVIPLRPIRSLAITQSHDLVWPPRRTQAPDENWTNRVLVPAGFDGPKDPPRLYWLGKETSAAPWIRGAFARTAAETYLVIKSLDAVAGYEDSVAPEQHAVRLLDSDKPAARAGTRDEQALGEFGQELSIVARSLGVSMPLPKLVVLHAVPAAAELALSS